MAPKLKDQFYDLGQMQNKSHKITYCKGCVDHRLQSVGATAADLINSSQAFKDAKALATTLRKELKASKDKSSEKKRTRADSTATPGPPSKKQQTQSTLSSLTFAGTTCLWDGGKRRAPEAGPSRNHIILFGMIRTTAPGILPTGKVVGGRLLNGAAEDIELRLNKRLKNRNVGLCTDGWKSQRKDSVNALCANIDFEDGASQCEQFAAMIDRIELKHGCIVIYFTTDADGGSKKGRLLLGKIRPWLILPSCWAHQFQLILGDYFKVYHFAAVIAEEATELIAWINNHSRALQLAVLQNRTAIIEAEVGAATSTEGERLREDAERMCARIEDTGFWHGLEMVLGDLEPICLGTNINQKDSTRLDQVLLTIAGIFLRFADHAEDEVRTAMLLSCFGPNANLNQLKCRNLLISVYHRINDRPDNKDTAGDRKAKENKVSKAFMQYLSGTGDFSDFNAEEWEQLYDNTDPLQVWEALADGGEVAELACFAIIIFNIVANQAGCERAFSRIKIEQENRRNRLALEKTDKRTKIRAEIRSEHEKQGLLKPRQARNNHKSTATLLSVPRYRDLLEDQDDEDSTERGRALVTSAEGWRTEVAKWIGDARAAERMETELVSEGEANDEFSSRLPTRVPAWKPMMLQVLFGGAEKPRKRRPSKRVMEEEEQLMEALANAEEDDVPDDGAIEIDSNEEYTV
ncbi:ribonuclease H-like domain-containing protein [Mycena sp. CBHHK59/15]|nr:ribonuclease H-like domain-containing protein [Mycena sp. CBHHK59/15]